MKNQIALAGTLAVLLAACGDGEPKKAVTVTRNNPLDSVSTLPFRAPDFSTLTDGDYRPAIPQLVASLPRGRVWSGEGGRLVTL